MLAKYSFLVSSLFRRVFGLEDGPDIPTGITGIGEGLVTNVAGFNAMRFFVGLFEGGLIPGTFVSFAENPFTH